MSAPDGRFDSSGSTKRSVGKPKGRRWLRFVLLVPLLAVVAHRVLIVVGRIPDTKLVRGEDLGSGVRQAIDKELRAGEEVVWYYCGDLLDAGGDGSLLTDRRLVGWATGFTDFTRYTTDLRDIEAIRVKFGSGFFGETEVLAWTDGWKSGRNTNGWGTYVDMPSRGDRDLFFVRDLVLRARDAGAEIVVVELDGNVTDEELAQIPGATRGVIEDMRDQPAWPVK